MTIIPLYVAVVGLLGNIFDGVSIIAISVVIFLRLLKKELAIEASFALLFGGLISNLMIVAAEPTNIKFQDALFLILDRVSPAYWLTNWPICVLGILLPAWYLSRRLKEAGIHTWEVGAPESITIIDAHPDMSIKGYIFSILALLALAAGIITHSVLQVMAVAMSTGGQVHEPISLWILLLPAGVLALIHILVVDRKAEGVNYLRQNWPIWVKLMIIFSLIWYLMNIPQSGNQNVFMSIFQWDFSLRYGTMIILSLLSSVTDNVALAAMQGGLILAQRATTPLAIWQIRLLFILLAWSGGFTPFGCLQSLALNTRLTLTTGVWFRQAFRWGVVSLIHLMAVGPITPSH